MCCKYIINNMKECVYVFIEFLQDLWSVLHRQQNRIFNVTSPDLTGSILIHYHLTYLLTYCLTNNIIFKTLLFRVHIDLSVYLSVAVQICTVRRKKRVLWILHFIALKPHVIYFKIHKNIIYITPTFYFILLFS